MKKEELFEIMGEVDEQKVFAASNEFKPEKSKHGNWFKRISMAACLSLLILGVARIAIGFIPNNGEDIYRKGVLYELDSISELPAEYDGKILVKNMSFSENVWMELYFNEGGKETNPNDWYSLLILDVTENGEVVMNCMFGDSTVDDWKVDMVFTKEATIIKNINGVDVQIASLASSPSFDYWYYIIFEYDNVVYDVRIRTNDVGYIYTVLNELLRN